jgi:hypothetical protein
VLTWVDLLVHGRCRKPALALAAACLLGGCGYSLVRADAAGPVPALALGVIQDDTAAGDLGFRVRLALARRLAARDRPALLPDASDDAPRLVGSVAALPDRTIAYDALGAAFEVRLRGRLELQASPPTAWPLWTSGDVEQAARYPRGATSAATESNRRLALEATVDALAQALLDRLLTSPEVKP